MAKKKRKVRVTKKDIMVQKKALKMTSAQRKKKIVPGPWTNKETGLELKVKLRVDKTSIMAEILGPSSGSYTKDELWGEKGWYPIVFNVETGKIKSIVEKYGMDDFLAATEKYLCGLLDKTNKPLYGKLIITAMTVDGSQRENKANRFVSCRGKTNRKNIAGFRAMRKGEYVTL